MISLSFFRFIVLLFVASSVLISCKKTADDVVDPNTTNSVSIEFENRVGDQKLVLGTPAYKTSAGEPFALTKLNYFVSTISLKNENGTIQKFPDQYFLIRQSDAASQVITLNNVPSGNYSEMSFTIGVDSAKSVSPVAERVGVLDVTSYGDDGMYWSWNSGYIFLKIEGTSTAVPKTASATQSFGIHVGGYGGGWNGAAKTVNNLRTVTVPMTTKATVRGNIAPEIHLFVDALTIFNGTNKISLATTNSVHSPAVAAPIADNYKAMFQVDHVHNDKQ
ncbi:MbnP family protein [Spirosoma lituiforme]